MHRAVQIERLERSGEYIIIPRERLLDFTLPSFHSLKHFNVFLRNAHLRHLFYIILVNYTNELFRFQMLPSEGINIISVVLHSHLAGRRLSLKHIRQGKELPRIVQDNHFDFDYQQSHTLEKEVKVLPGDELVAECVYGTLDRKHPTLGGYAVSQEMCLAFIVHYPKTPLAACYSMTPVQDLFKTLGVLSLQGMSMDELETLFLE